MQQDQIIAFRLHQNHLLKPLPLSQMEEAAASGIQNTVPGTLPLSLGVRVRDFTLQALDKVLQKKKTLVEITGIRGASYVVASEDYSLFTSSVYPSDDKELLKFVGSSSKFLKENKILAGDAVEKIAATTMKILNHRALTQDEIHEEWRKALPKTLLRWCRGCDSFHVPYSLVMAVGLKGIFCFGPVKEGMTAYVRADQWLPAKCVNHDLESTRRKLTQRFLHFYGPNNSKGLSTWAGISKQLAQEFWNLVEDEIIEIPGLGGHSLLKKDLPLYKSPPTPKGIILLPPKDAYLNLPDRETIAEKKFFPLVWKILGNPGVILHNGELVGLWKSQKKQETLSCQFEILKKIPVASKKEIEQKVENLAPLRECKTIQVKWE